MTEHPRPTGRGPAAELEPLVDLARRAGADVTAPEVLADHDGTVVLAVGDVVIKTHRADLDPGLVAARTALAARLPELMTPLPVPAPDLPPYVAVRGGRAVTLWPRGVPVDRTDPEAAPWGVLGAIVGSLHRHPPEVAGGVAAAGPDRVARALRALRAADHPDAGPVLAAAATLEPWTCGAAPWPSAGHVVHGDLHFGQLVTPPGGTALVLLDVDDVGTGPAVWDLARPAAWFLTGMIDERDWATFLEGYRHTDGPVLAGGRDPWPDLEPVARALTVQTAARTLLTCQDASSDTAAQWLVDACRRIVGGYSIPAPP